MKFAFSSCVFRHRPLAEAIAAISAAGFSAIEIMADHPHALPEEMNAAALSEMQETLKNRKLTACALDSTTTRFAGEAPGASWIEEDWEARERRIRYTLDCLRMAAATGIPHVVTCCGGAVPASMNRREAWRLFVANMHRVLPLARRLGVKLLVAAHPGALIETSTHLSDLIGELAADYDSIGVYFDAGAFYCADEEPCEAWETLHTWAGAVRLADVPESRSYMPKPLGEGATDVAALLRCLRDTSFDGYVSVIHDTKDKSAEDTLATSVNYLRQAGYLESGTG